MTDLRKKYLLANIAALFLTLLGAGLAATILPVTGGVLMLIGAASLACLWLIFRSGALYKGQASALLPLDPSP